MAWDLWSSSFDEVSDDDYSEVLGRQCDYFGCGHDEIKEDSLNVESCVQVLRILLTNADNEIEELEKDLMCLQNELAWTENENWPEICCSALTERIKWLDDAVTNLKSDHADDADMQLLLNSEPAETLHEILKALHKDHCQDTHGQRLEENTVNPIVNVTEHAPDIGSNNIDSNGIMREGGEEDFGTSEPSKSSELILELHENRSDDPEKTETKELLTLSPGRSPDLEVVSSVPYHSDRMISDTLDDKVTGDEDVRHSQIVTTDTCQVLNPFLSKGNANIPSEAKEETTALKENVCSDDDRLAIIKRSLNHLIFAESGQSLNPILSKGNKNIPSETKKVNITVKENVCSDDHRLAIIKGSQLIAKDTGQILNPFTSKGSGDLPSEAKIMQDENTNLNGNVCSDDYRPEIIKTMEMYSSSRFGTCQQEETENSDLATKLCDFAPKTAGRVCRNKSKVARDEDSESMNVPLQIVYPQKLCFADTESSAFKENNGNNARQAIKFEKATFSAENSVSISLPGMQMKNVLCTRLQLTDEEKPQAQDLKSEVAVNFSKSSKRFTLKSKAQGKKKSEFEACSANEMFPLEVSTSTSKNVTTKRQRKPKNEFMDGKITKKAVQTGQYENDDNTILLSDSDDDVSTKRQRKPNSYTAGTTLNEPTNSKVTKRSVQPGQPETAGNAIVPYDSEFSELQKKRQISEVQNSIDNYLDITKSNGKSPALVDDHNESSALLPITLTETMETLKKKKMPDLRHMAKTLNMKGYAKFRKEVLIEELLKPRSSC